MSQSTAIVLGGTEDHILLIENLKSRGYKTILCDYLDNPPAKSFADLFIRESILDYEKILEISKKYKADLVLTVCIDQAIPVMAAVSKVLNLPCYLTVSQSIAFTNKALMKRKMIEADIPCASFQIVNIRDLDNLPIDNFNYPLIMKPSDTNSSKGVIRINGPEQFINSFGYVASFSRSGDLVVEEYMIGKEYSLDFILINGSPILISHSQLRKSSMLMDRFIINRCTMPSDLSTTALNSIYDFACKISEFYQYINGPLLIQVIVNQDDVKVIEFSCRVGGGSKHHLIAYYTGFDIINYHVDLVLGKKINQILINENNDFYGCYYIYSQKGLIQSYQGLDECRDRGDILDFYIYKMPGTKIEGSDSSAHRPFGFILKRSSRNDIEMSMTNTLKKIHIWGDDGTDLIIRENI